MVAGFAVVARSRDTCTIAVYGMMQVKENP